MIKRKVAIVGNALPSRKEAPFNDPSFEIWGMNLLFNKTPGATRWFDMHFSRSEDIAPEHYREWLAEQTAIPVYTQRPLKGVRSCVPYPKVQVVHELGPYFTSTVSWMLGLALHEVFQEIHLYGVNMAPGTEYVDQKANCEWLLGVAFGRGVTIQIPPSSNLLKAEYLYGYNERSEQ